MEKQKTESRSHRRSSRMPATAASGGTPIPRIENIMNMAASSSASSSVAADSSPSRPSTPAAARTASAEVPSATSLKYRYSREELLSMRNSVLSKTKPEFLTSVLELLDGCLEATAASEEQISLRSGMINKKHLNMDQRLCGTQPDDCDVDQHIALVPQRMSFGAGCYVSSGRANNSPEIKHDRSRRDGHRIGSGRIQISEKYDRELHDRQVLSSRQRECEDYWHNGSRGNNSKVLKREYDMRHSEGYRDGRYLGGPRSGTDEPEWFTEGPLSQSDTIELHGFESTQKTKGFPKERPTDSAFRDVSKFQSNALKKVSSDSSGMDASTTELEKKEEFGICSTIEDKKGIGRTGEKTSVESSSADATLSNHLKSEDGTVDPSGRVQPTPSSVSSLPLSPDLPHHLNPSQDANELDFDSFFNVETIPGLNDIFNLESEQAKSGSRFKQWFHFSSHGNSHCESRRSSLTDEFGYINDIIYGHGSPLGQISPPPPPLFGPLQLCSQERCSDETQNLLELLQKAHGDAAINLGGGNSCKTLKERMVAPSSSATEPAAIASVGAARGSIEAAAKDVEAGLKAILSGAIVNNSVFSGLPSVSQLGTLAAKPPSGAKVLLAEELEAKLVSSGLSQNEPCQSTYRQKHESIYSEPASRNDLPPLSAWNGNNSGTLSLCSLPVLPIGTKVTLLSELEAGLKGINDAGHGGITTLPPGGASDGQDRNLLTARWSVPGQDPSTSVGQQQTFSGNALSGRIPDMTAYKKLFGLIIDSDSQTTNNTLPIVTSPTSASMSSLEANQPNNSLANNQRDFIQRYLLQQQQLKMLNHAQPPPPPPPPPPEGSGLTSCGFPPHLLPPDLPYLASGSAAEPLTAERMMASNSGVADVGLISGLCRPSGYGRSSFTGPSLNLPQDDMPLITDLAPELRGPFVPGVTHMLSPDGQPHVSTSRGRWTSDSQIHHNLPLQHQETNVGHQVNLAKQLQLLQQPSNKTSQNHPVAIQQQLQQEQLQQQLIQHQLQHQQQQLQLQLQQQQQMLQQQQQQQMNKLMRIAVQDQFPTSLKPSMTTLNKPAALSPIPPPHLTLQPPPQTVSTGLSVLGPQSSLLQQLPQSPRRAPSPIMFGNQPPVNLTAPLPVHLGPMTPVLSPTLSPNTLQVAQPGSNLSSPVMRVPSPQELSGLAQSILQNALIKKQLEEQKERFIKRQQERNKSPKPQTSSSASITTSGGTKSSNTLSGTTVAGTNVLDTGKVVPSFLPTSVLRKMVNSKMDEKMAHRVNDGEKSVPLLKVVQPDEESVEDEANDNKVQSDQPMRNSTNANLECQSLKCSLDDQLSDISAKSTVATDSSLSLQVPPSQLLPLSQTSEVSLPSDNQLSLVTMASSSLATDSSSIESGQQNHVTRRLVGQGLMIITSSGATVPTNLVLPSPSPQMASGLSGGLNPTSTNASFASAGRQIKGKKVPEQLPIGPIAANKNKPTDQQTLQQQYLSGNNVCSNNRAPAVAALNLHALEVTKLLEQQRIGLLSPLPVAPPLATQFVPAVPESSPYGVTPLPRMLVHPTFGVNAGAPSNALLLQRLAYPNLQRAGLPSVNHLNLNQLALIHAVQLQALQQQQQQQQQQQPQLWNRNTVRNLNNRAPHPAFVPSSLSVNMTAAAAGGIGGSGGTNKRNGPLPVIGINGLKTSSENVGGGAGMRDNEAPGIGSLGFGLQQQSNDASRVSSEPIYSNITADKENSQQQMQDIICDNHQAPGSRNDLLSDVGNLAKWFGSDVFHHHMPPLVTSAGQKVLTVDEIECWQHAVSKS